MSDTILSIEAIRAGLAKERSLSDAARATDIHYNQIWRIKQGIDTNIRYDNLKKLSDYLTEKAAKNNS